MGQYDLPDWLETEVLLEKDIKGRTDMPHDEFGPIKIVRLHDGLRNKTWGYLVVHNLNRGLVAIGGTRLAEDVTLGEIYGLAKAMTFKNAGAMLPIGGAKSGFMIDPEYMFANPEEKILLMKRFAKALWLFPEYVAGPDMGTNEDDMQTLYDSFTSLGGGTHSYVGAWQAVTTATEGAPAGTIDSPAGTVNTPSGTEGTPTGTGSSPTGSDSGAGNSDTLLLKNW